MIEANIVGPLHQGCSPESFIRRGVWTTTIGLSCVLLAGCQSAPVAVWQTLAAAIQSGPDGPPAVPNVSFLRVVSPSGTAFLVLGDTDTVDGGGRAQVWYSAGRQVLRLEQGRLSSTAGLPVDWRFVSTSSRPTWSSVQATPGAYFRRRDEFPGYRFGITERVTVRAAQPPAAGWVRQWTGRPGVAWFAEEAEPWQQADRPLPPAASARSPLLAGAESSRRHNLPTAWFAVDLKAPGEPVLYSRQCLSREFCLELEPVVSVPPAAVPASPKAPA
jgi:hypothetical protein